MITISAMDETKVKTYVSQLQSKCNNNDIYVSLTPQLYSEATPNYWELKMSFEQKLGASTLLRAIAQIAFTGDIETDFKIVKIFHEAQSNALVNMYNANNKR